MARKVNDYAIKVDSSGFNNNFLPSDDDLPKVLKKMDELPVGGTLETKQSLVVTDSNYTDSLVISANTNVINVDLTNTLTNDWTPTDITGVVEGRFYTFEIIKRKTNVGVDLSTVRALGHVGYNDDINPFIELSGISNNQRAVINGIGLANGMVQFDTLIITDSGYYEDIINITFSSATINNDNSIITLSFSDGAWGANDSTTPLALSSMTYTFNISGGTASGWTATSITGVSGTTLTGGETTVEIHGSISGTSDGNEVITIEPVSVYSSTGTAMDSNESINVNLNANSSVTYAGNFDGSNIYGTIPRVADFDLDYVEIEVKFKLNAIDKYQGVFALQGLYNGNSGCQIYIGSSNDFYFKWTEDGSTANLSGFYDTNATINTDYVWDIKAFLGTDNVIGTINGNVDSTKGTLGGAIYYDGSAQSLVGAFDDGGIGDFMDGIIYYIKIWELDSSGTRIAEKLYIDFQNGPQGTTEDNNAVNAPAGTTMTWQDIPNPGDQYVVV